MLVKTFDLLSYAPTYRTASDETIRQARTARKKLGWSRGKLAAMAGTSLIGVALFESGSMRNKEAIPARICRALSVRCGMVEEKEAATWRLLIPVALLVSGMVHHQMLPMFLGAILPTRTARPIAAFVAMMTLFSCGAGFYLLGADGDTASSQIRDASLSSLISLAVEFTMLPLSGWLLASIPETRLKHPFPGLAARAALGLAVAAIAIHVANGN